MSMHYQIIAIFLYYSNLLLSQQMYTEILF